MKPKIKAFVLFVIIIALTVQIPGFMDYANYSKAADEAEWSINDPVDDDTFTIVEIVPYKGMGEIGYLIGGQEPVEKERMSITNAAAELDFLGQAVKVYPSYREKPLTESGNTDPGWMLARTNSDTYEEGYYEEVGYLRGGTHYRIPGEVNYEPVTEGTGDFVATLGSNIKLENTYKDVTTPLNRKNVKAYFVYEHPSEVELLNPTAGYEPYSVTEIPDRTGDYDYDSVNQRFILNQGKGKYDVLFVITSNTTNVYHMTADYEIVTDQSGDYSVDPKEFTYIPKEKGNYRSVQTYQYVRYTNLIEWLFCNYEWHPAEFPKDIENYEVDKNGNMWVRQPGEDEYYQYSYQVELVNNEWFKRMALGIPANLVDTVPVRVITITPEELNQSVNQKYIDSADLFYLNSNYYHNQNYLRLYETYHKDGINSSTKYANATETVKQKNLNFADHDLSWSSVEKIFKRVAGIGCRKAGILFDGNFYADAVNGIGRYSDYRQSVTINGVNYQGSGNRGATSVNIAKLYLMLYQRNRIDFYNSFMNTDFTELRHITGQNVSDKVNSSKTTGYYIRPDRPLNYSGNEIKYWNGNTFLPYGLNEAGQWSSFSQNQFVSKGILNYNVMQTSTDILNNFLVVGGNNVGHLNGNYNVDYKGIFDRNFNSELQNNIPSDVREEVVNHINAVEGTNLKANDIKIAHLVNYILNNGQGYGNTGGISYPDGGSVEGIKEGITEDPDTAVEDGTDGSNTRNFKRVLNLQPTASFAAGESVIRNIFDGQQVQIINMTSTQFNGSIEDINERYDMIYMGSSAGRFNMLLNDTVFNDENMYGAIYFSEGDEIKDKDRKTTYRYRGNDLTEQKVRELKSFLQAGYPIVADQVLYQQNSTKIKKNTNLSSFLTQVKGKNNFMNYYDFIINRSSFMTRLNHALNVVRPRLKLIEKSSKQNGKNYVYVNPETELFTVKFTLSPKDIIPSPYTYNAYLYLDRNGDGIFDDHEKLKTISSDGSSWLGIRESFTRINNFQYDMSGLNGIYQWKVIVRRLDSSGNEMPEIHGSLTGYVANKNRKELNILHITEEGSYELEKMVEDTSKLINRYTGEDKLTDYKLNFETMTIKEFENLYLGEENAYTVEKDSERNKLSKYHLLILDNPKTEIDDTNGAVLNIREEIKKNLAVVYTKNALGYGSRQDKLYDRDQNSFLDQYTYNHINLRASYVKWWMLPFDLPQLYIYSYMTGDYGYDLTNQDAYRTNYITKANEGSITRYPYQINDAVRIADTTFSDNVTIDMDLSKTNRLIGWYSLSDSRSPVVRAVYNLGGNTNQLYRGTYSSSPNDVKNNYYLFSNGLCFYSGITLANADRSGNDEEIKLFINTLIAAYKASGREVSSPPIIEIKKPEPEEMDGKQSIKINQEMITAEDNLELLFKISDSSSLMNLEISFEGDTPLSGNWNQTVYEVDTAGNIVAELQIDHAGEDLADKAENKTYMLKIPKSQLNGKNVLTVKAKNEEGDIGLTAVELIYIKQPVVTIIDPVPAVNDDTQYIYCDIDYSIDDVNFDASEDMRIEFMVESEDKHITLEFTSGQSRLTTEDISVYAVNEDGTEKTGEQDLDDATQGRYALYLPMKLMKNINIREFTVTATDSLDYSGNTSFSLLRRNLFPLD